MKVLSWLVPSEGCDGESDLGFFSWLVLDCLFPGSHPIISYVNFSVQIPPFYKDPIILDYHPK